MLGMRPEIYQRVEQESPGPVCRIGQNMGLVPKKVYVPYGKHYAEGIVKQWPLVIA